MSGRTAMVQSYMGPQQHPELPPKRVVDFLRGSGIHRVVTGHQPFGDSPLVMRHPDSVQVGGAPCCRATANGDGE